MKIALRIVGFLLAIAIFWLLVTRIGAEQIVAQLREVGPGFVWILLLHVAAIALAALPWWVVLPRDVRPSITGAIVSRFFAQGAAAILPLFGFGGELVRLLWLRKGTRAPGVAAIVVDRLLYGVSAVSVLILGLIGLAHVPALPVDYTRAAAISVAVIVGGISVLAVVARRGIGARIHRLVHRMHKKLDRGDTRFGEDVDRHIGSMLRVRARGPWIGWVLHVLARAVIGFEVYLVFRFLGVSLAWDEALVFAALPAILAITGALVPSQLGVYEGANALVAASFGISPPTAVAVVLVLRLRQLAGAAVLGPALLLWRRKRAPMDSLAASAGGEAAAVAS